MLRIHDLPAVNATLNAAAALLLVTGFALIRNRRWVAHRNVMVAALACSTLFLTSYLIYHSRVGPVHFPCTRAAGTGSGASGSTESGSAGAASPKRPGCSGGARAGSGGPPTSAAGGGPSGAGR